MVDRTPYGSDDDQSSLAALDFSGSGGGEYGADDTYGGASAFDDYSYGHEESYDAGTDLDAIQAVTEEEQPQDEKTDLEAIQATTDEDQGEEDLGPITTVTNPPGTVTVSTLISVTMSDPFASSSY